MSTATRHGKKIQYQQKHSVYALIFADPADHIPPATPERDDMWCEHGQRVGGIGVDWMCGWCEMGTTWAEYREAKEYEFRREQTRQGGWLVFIAMGKSMEAGDFGQISAAEMTAEAVAFFKEVADLSAAGRAEYENEVSA